MSGEGKEKRKWSRKERGEGRKERRRRGEGRKERRRRGEGRKERRRRGEGRRERGVGKGRRNINGGQRDA